MPSPLVKLERGGGARRSQQIGPFLNNTGVPPQGSGSQSSSPLLPQPKGNLSSLPAFGTSAVAPSLSSPSQSTTVFTEDLIGLFECPVCFDHAIPPLLQCQSGHMVCQPCRGKLSCCPTCRGPIGNIRNLAMEKVASTLAFPCKFSNLGCQLTMPHTAKLDHEEHCELRPYHCPCPGTACPWSGKLEGVLGHLQTMHKSITTLQGEDIVFLATDISLPGAVDWVMMQSCFGQHFMLILEKQEKIDGSILFFAVVQFVGSRKEAQNYAYRLELNGTRSNRRLTWEATPRSIQEGVHHSQFSRDCLMFDAHIAQLFAENGNLGINVTLSTSP